MKRLIMLAVLCAFVLGGMAYATETRVMTMGDVNNIVKDEANIWLYPSTINYYPKLFIGEFWGNDGEGDYSWFYQVGANFLLGEDSETPRVLGFYFSEEEYEHTILDYYYEFSDEGYAWDTDASRGINLYYGQVISDMPFGFYFGYWFDSDKNEDSLPSRNMEWGLTRYEFKFGLSPMQKKLDLSFGIGLTSWTDKDYWDSDLGVVDLTKPNGNMDISFMARYWMDPMGKYTLIPHAEVLLGKQGMDWYGEGEAANSWIVAGTGEFKYTQLGLGLGMNYDAAENILVVGDFGFSLDSYKETVEFTDTAMARMYDYEAKDKYTILPYFKIGIDAKVFKWMDFRAGVITAWERGKWEADREDFQDPWYPGYVDQSWAEPYTSTYLGAGFNWGNLTIDAAINPDWMTNGPYFITGDDTYNFAERVSLKYAF